MGSQVLANAVGGVPGWLALHFRPKLYRGLPDDHVNLQLRLHDCDHPIHVHIGQDNDIVTSGHNPGSNFLATFLRVKHSRGYC